MKTCPKCLKHVEDESLFCSYCGNRLEEKKEEKSLDNDNLRVCKNCGKEVALGFMSCPFCGADMITGNVPQGFGFSNSRKYSSNYDLKSKNHTTTFVLGLLGTILVALNYFGVYFVHIIGLILGIVGLSLVSADKRDEMTYSKAGFVLSLIAVIGGGLAFLIGFIFALMYT